MKKQPIENLKSRAIFVSLAIISSFLLVINFIPLFVVNAGITTEFTGNFNIDRIAYVNQSNPDINHLDYLGENAVIGNSCETYVHFNLELLPEQTEKLYFFFNEYDHGQFYGGPIGDIEINLILVDSHWNSSEINWNNKPKHEEIIKTVNASEIMQSYYVEYYNFENAIDLTEILLNNQLNEISFCINFTEHNAEWMPNVYIYGIKLLWNYEKLIISYTTIISSSIIFSLLIGTVYYLRKDVYSCPECDTKRKITERVCSSCGTNFKDEIIIKGSDYQLILILLWVFALFEVIVLILTLQSNYFYIVGALLILLLFIPLVIFSSIQIIRKIKKYRELRLLLKES